jgi:hypothetical protein
MKTNESKLQQGCVLWFRHQHAEKLLFAIPNGGNRDAITGAILRKEGVLAGVADLFLAYPNRMFAGLFIEMKTKIGKQSDTQTAFGILAANYGYQYVVCRSFEDFKVVVTNYLADEIGSEHLNNQI